MNVILRAVAVSKDRFEIFQEDGHPDHWRWRLVSKNGEYVATSGEWFVSKANARRAIETVKELASKAVIREESTHTKGTLLTGSLSQLR